MSAVAAVISAIVAIGSEVANEAQSSAEKTGQEEALSQKEYADRVMQKIQARRDLSTQMKNEMLQYIRMNSGILQNQAAEFGLRTAIKETKNRGAIDKGFALGVIGGLKKHTKSSASKPPSTGMSSIPSGQASQTQTALGGLNGYTGAT